MKPSGAAVSRGTASPAGPNSHCANSQQPDIHTVQDWRAVSRHLDTRPLQSVPHCAIPIPHKVSFSVRAPQATNFGAMGRHSSKALGSPRSSYLAHSSSPIVICYDLCPIAACKYKTSTVTQAVRRSSAHTIPFRFSISYGPRRGDCSDTVRFVKRTPRGAIPAIVFGV